MISSNLCISYIRVAVIAIYDILNLKIYPFPIQSYAIFETFTDLVQVASCDLAISCVFLL